MKLIRFTGSLRERHEAENARAAAEELKAMVDYNIMMGNLEDPKEEEEEEAE